MSVANGRDSRGRFASGNQLGRANGGRKRVEFNRQALIDEAIPPERWATMLAAQARKAEEGDTTAFKVLWEFRFGKATETVDATMRGALLLQVSELRRLMMEDDDDDSDG